MAQGKSYSRVTLLLVSLILASLNQEHCGHCPRNIN